MTDSRIATVVDTLSSLILHHASLLASRQYSPTADSDRDDEEMVEHKKWVVELRRIRHSFEALVTGVVE